MSKLAISLYLYHPDLFHNFFSLLQKIDIEHTLYLGLSLDQDYSEFFKDEGSLINSYRNNLKFFYYPNAGSDNCSFLHHINLISEPYFIKIHSKKSNIGLNKEVDWLSIFLDSLLSSNTIIEKNIKAFDDQPNLGMISSSICNLSDFENLNKSKIQEICNMLDINYLKVKNKFAVSGTMFMSRTSLFQKYFTIKKTKSLINKMIFGESGRCSDDLCGKYTHSLERIYGYLIKDSNMYFSGSHENIFKLIKNGVVKTLVVTYKKDCYIKMHNNLKSFYEPFKQSEENYLYGKISFLPNSRARIIWLKNQRKKIEFFNIEQETLDSKIPCLVRVP